MKKWLAIGLPVILVVVGLAAAWRLRTGPYYQGKSLEAWTWQLGMPDEKKHAEAAAAFKVLGAKAVPGLVRLLRAEDSVWLNHLWDIAPRIPYRARRVIYAKVPAPDARVLRAAAAQGLGIIGPEASGAVPALIQALKDAEPRVGLFASMSLGQIGKAALPNLVESLRDPDYRVRRSVGYAIGEIGPEAASALPALVDEFSDTDENVRAAVVGTVCKIGGPALQVVLEAVKERRGLARQTAARALSCLGPPQMLVVGALQEMVGDPDAASRRRAVQTMRELRFIDRNSVQIMTSALKDPAPEVQVEAAKALAQAFWKAEGAVNDLVGCLNSESAEVREVAAQTLGQIGPKASAALPALGSRLNDPVEAVRAAASNALTRIQTGPNAPSGSPASQRP